MDDAEIDIALLRRLARGEEQALAELYDRYADRLLALAFKLLRNRSEAEDAIHDVFMEIWRRAGDFDPKRGSVRSWIVMRTRSRCIDRIRKARVRATEPEDRAPPAAVSPDAEAAVEGGKVREALAVLPEPQREVVLLAYYGGLSSREIGERLSIPTGTVKSRMAAALGQLRGHLRVPAAGGGR